MATDYLFLGDHIPAAATASRFDDHRSYFAMNLEAGHEHVDDAEREAVFLFMAADLRSYADSISTIRDLRAALETGLFENAHISRRASALTGT